MRGEECQGRRPVARSAESPPRARGRARVWLLRLGHAWNHPRVRGEESVALKVARAIRGITPACAGKSVEVVLHAEEVAESPPRARGRGLAERRGGDDCGITPACAGKSQLGAMGWTGNVESPPRARGRALSKNFDTCSKGITPACAGKRVMKMRPSRVWAYPLSANFSFFFGTSFECRAIPERGARRLFGCQASGLATCYASRIQEQTIGCFTGVHCLYPTSRSLRNGTEYNRAES